MQSTTAKPNLQKTIVIDAGHGGKDGGAVGKQTGITESALNLEYSLYLKELFEQFGFKVVLTRTDMGGLYSPLASNKKKSEMEKRRKIIENANPCLVISVHMNSFSTGEGRGAQVFYGEEDSSGEVLAQKVQTSLNRDIEYAKKTAKIGDYFILNTAKSPAILIECGFLSNPQEELLLQEEKYMHKFCYCVLCGVLSYFDFS
ncbi:MAG: N-acetylmuramoyl-L-alanine amidase [Clostridia bacterium]|nr:N-acetylmuramoyl-L-alanine amidase [Clostridia bacterium]